MPKPKPKPKPAPDDPLENPVFSPALRELALRGMRRNYPKGKLLIEEGDFGDTLYIILSGRLRVFSNKGHGDREFTLGTYGAGEYLGEMGLDGGPRSASVETVERSECAAVSRQTLEAFIAEHPSFAFEVINKLIRRARDATVSATRMALNDVYGRLKLLLEEQARLLADGRRVVTDRLTHLDLAHRLGCTREMVGRVIRELERGGYIEMHAEGIHLLRALPARW